MARIETSKFHKHESHVHLLDDGYIKIGDDDDARLTADGTGVDITGIIIVSDMPTSDPHVSGQLWNSSGTVTVSSG